MWLTGLVAPRHVGSSQTRARTRVPCIGRQTLNHCATREAPSPFLKRSLGPCLSPFGPLYNLPQTDLVAEAAGMALEAGRLRLGRPRGWILGEDLFPVMTSHGLSLGYAETSCLLLFYKDINPIMGAPPSRPPLNRIAFPNSTS